MLAKYPGPVSRSFKSIPLEAGHFQKKLQPRGQKNQTRCKHKRTDVPDFWNTPKMTWDMVKLVNDGSKKKQLSQVWTFKVTLVIWVCFFQRWLVVPEFLVRNSKVPSIGDMRANIFEDSTQHFTSRHALKHISRPDL